MSNPVKIKSSCFISSVLVGQLTERTFVETLTLSDKCVTCQKKNEINQSKRADGNEKKKKIRGAKQGKISCEAERSFDNDDRMRKDTVIGAVDL